MRIVAASLAITLSATVPLLALSGCSDVAGSGWTYSEATDPITSVRTVRATRQFTPDGEPKVVAEVEFSCAKGEGGPDPFGLFLTLSSFSAKVEGTTLPPAALSANTIEYQLDALGGTVTAETEQVESPYNNVFKINFAALYGGSPKVASSLMREITPNGDLTGSYVGMAALFASYGNIEQGEVIPPEKSLPIVLASIIDKPALNEGLRGPLARASGNYRWGFRTLAIRYRATTADQGGNDYVVMVPMNEPEVTKVAAACGWSASPAPLPARPSAPALAAEEAEANAIIAAEESAPELREDPLENADLSTSATARPSPSFDCGKASTPIEKMICGSAELIEADASLMTAYRLKLSEFDAGSIAEEQFRKRQRDWLSSERARCSSEECLMQAYQSRTAELQAR